MTRAHDSPERKAEKIEQQAAEWVTRIDLRDTPEEWAALDAWLAASPRHRAAFLRLSVAWQRANGLKKLAPLSGKVDEDLFAPASSDAQPSYEDVLEGRAISLDAYLPEHHASNSPRELGDVATSLIVAPEEASVVRTDAVLADSSVTAAPTRTLRVVASNDNPYAADRGWAAMRHFRGQSQPRNEGDPTTKLRSSGGGSSGGVGSGARSLFASRLAASLAAITVAAVGGLSTWYIVDRNDGDVYSTRVGEFHRVPLSDGSSIALNTDSKVRVRYTATSRHVELVRGEALFEVAKNPSRPFDVEAGETTVRAVGTAFSVRLRGNDNDERVDVVVSEGRIAINPPSKQTYTAGSVATVRNGRIHATTVVTENITGRLSWTTGRLVFQGEQLGEVVAEINRYNQRKIQVTDPDIAGLRIGGTFQATDPNGFARALDRAFGIKSHLVTPSFGAEVIRLDSGVP